MLEYFDILYIYQIVEENSYDSQGQNMLNLNLYIYILNHVCTVVIKQNVAKILTKKSFLWVLKIVTFVMENVMEMSWNFVLKKLYEPCYIA